MRTDFDVFGFDVRVPLRVQFSRCIPVFHLLVHIAHHRSAVWEEETRAHNVFSPLIRAPTCSCLLLLSCLYSSTAAVHLVPACKDELSDLTSKTCLLLAAHPTRYRPLPSAVRAYLAARVNRRVMATNYRVVDRYQSMEQQPAILWRLNRPRVTPLSVPEGLHPLVFSFYVFYLVRVCKRRFLLGPRYKHAHPV